MKLMFDRDLNKELAVFDHERRQFRIPRKLKEERYEIIDLLAVGGMGIIFIARDTRLNNKKVLIKRCLYKPSLFEYSNDVNRKKEILAVRRSVDTEYAAMMHGWARRIPSISIPLDKFEDDNPDIFGPHKDVRGQTFNGEPDLYKTEPYLVISFFTGYPIKSDHPEVRRNVIGFTRYFINNTGNVLKRFHRPYTGQGKTFDFFYCDLKPDNVLSTNEKQVVLIDMGSFAIRVDGKPINDVTTTQGYCAPELKNQQTTYLSPSVDVYTLAVCAFELITGIRAKLDQDGSIQLDWREFKKNIPSTEIADLEKTFRKALETDPHNRFQTMQEFLDALGRRKTRPQGNTDTLKYINKSFSVPVAVTQEWIAERGDIDRVQQGRDPIICYNVWSKKNYFDLEACTVSVNRRIRYESIQEGLVNDLFERSKKNLVQNITFFPELIDVNQENLMIVHTPPFFSFIGNRSDNNYNEEIKRRLKSILYRLTDLFNMHYRMIGISRKTIQFDSLNRPFIAEFWLVLNEASGHMSENPMVHDILGNNVILPPEIKKERKWENERSFSYLAGIAVLLMIDHAGIFDLYKKGALYEKQHFELFVRRLSISEQLKEIILSLINPNPNMRATPYEAISKIKNQQIGSSVMTRQTTYKGVQLQYVEGYKKFRLEFTQINKIVNQFMHFSQLDKHIILHREPSPAFLEILNKSKTQWHSVENKQAENRIVDLLREKTRNGQNEMVVLIIDESIMQMQSKLMPILIDFKKVILFSKRNPFGSIGNVSHYDITQYMIKKG